MRPLPRAHCASLALLFLTLAATLAGRVLFGA